ncbi:hypothetical protein CC2G_001765 [Coprinopsis cinerea AmutBmut pab1-1]|nr:hypothetical protein CC2G_001765 [Coprinopsis cinerea AmutBmut pab1-1]
MCIGGMGPGARACYKRAIGIPWDIPGILRRRQVRVSVPVRPLHLFSLFTPSRSPHVRPSPLSPPTPSPFFPSSSVRPGHRVPPRVTFHRRNADEASNDTDNDHDDSDDEYEYEYEA